MIFLKDQLRNRDNSKERSSSREPRGHPAPIADRARPLAATRRPPPRFGNEWVARLILLYVMGFWTLMVAFSLKRMLSTTFEDKIIVTNSWEEHYRGQKPYQKARRRRKKCHIVIHQANVDPPPGGVGWSSEKTWLSQMFQLFFLT